MTGENSERVEREASSSGGAATSGDLLGGPSPVSVSTEWTSPLERVFSRVTSVPELFVLIGRGRRGWRLAAHLSGRRKECINPAFDRALGSYGPIPVWQAGRIAGNHAATRGSLSAIVMVAVTGARWSHRPLWILSRLTL